ncbi:hypothetical protein ACWDRB_61295 [Nonomuraea sp. NPDC003707]
MSHSFLYGYEILRQRSKQLRQRSTLPWAVAIVGVDADIRASADNVVLALTAEITRLRPHTGGVAELRRALEQAHGENLILRRELAYRGWSGSPPSS